MNKARIEDLFMLFCEDKCSAATLSRTTSRSMTIHDFNNGKIRARWRLQNICTIQFPQESGNTDPVDPHCYQQNLHAGKISILTISEYIFSMKIMKTLLIVGKN